MPAVSLLVLAVLSQPVQHRVEVLGRGGDAFWSAGARGSELWERVRGEVRLEARRNSKGASSAELSLHLTRNAESWIVELSSLRPGSAQFDVDLPGPGGLVHAAVALAGTARVTRGGELLTDAASLRALALTTGFHADDGTFRAVPAGRTGDLELLIQLDGLPGGDTLDLGFEHPEITLDGHLVAAAPLADATAPAWPGARRGAGVGGSGSESAAVSYGPVPSLPPPLSSQQPGDMQPPSAPAPANSMPAGPLPSSPSPANSAPANALPGPSPANAAPATALPTTPAPSSDAPALPSGPAPANAAPAVPLPATPAPVNSLPAQPLPSSPAPSAPAPVH
ncbi:MAG TPA: hypothetical protein VFN91_13415 [Myxococcaceae bacterium]|nr:hypothetical protein [Myxococcaceae bacterium]